MSWEEMFTRSVPCPCGKGTISQTEYGDDWNRFKYGPVVFDCEDCKKKYHVESVTFYGRCKWDGDTTTHYLVPNGYPAYDGISVSKIYPQKFLLREVPFFEYLIKNYPFAHLVSAFAEMSDKKAFAKLTGLAKEICKKYQQVYKTARITVILPQVARAIEKYRDYEDNRENRAVIEEQMQKAFEAYERKKRKHCILLNL